MAIIVNNRCLENRLVALGLPDGATAFVHGNTFKRTGGGAPPLVAIKSGSTAVFSNNSVTGGGVAGLLAQGRILAVGNSFHGKGPGQGSAIWVWKGSTIAVAHNRFDGYRNAINASDSKVTAIDNLVSRFEKAAIVVRKPSAASHAFDTIALSDNPQFIAASVDGQNQAAGNGNVIKPTTAAGDLPETLGRFWPTAKKTAVAQPTESRTQTIENGHWKLVVVTKDGKATYRLYDLKSDPQEATDRSEHLEQIVFHLRGLLEKQAGGGYKATLKGGRPGR